MSIKKYFHGQRISIEATFRYRNALVDPSVVIFKYQKASAVSATVLQFGVNTDVVRDSLGKYHVEVNGDDDGTMQYRIEALGSFQGAFQGKLRIVPANV